MVGAATSNQAAGMTTRHDQDPPHTAFTAASVRAVGVALVTGLVGGGIASVLPPREADIGWGAIVFVVLAVASFAWAVRDGSRAPLDRLVGVWGTTALLLGVLAVVIIAVRDADGIDLQTLLLDVTILIPVTAIAVALPALVGASLGRAVSHRSASRP